MSQHQKLPQFHSDPSELREFGRRKTLKQARIVSANLQPMSAVVVDISLGGARLQVGCGAEVPSRFDLEIFEDAVSIGCEVVHTGPNFVGVQFIRLPRRIRPGGVREAMRLKNLIEALTANGPGTKAAPET
jgi:PilZ domain